MKRYNFNLVRYQSSSFVAIRGLGPLLSLFSIVDAVFTQIWEEKENEFLMVAHFLKEERKQETRSPPILSPAENHGVGLAYLS